MSRRLELTKSDDPEEIEQDLCAVVPESKWAVFPHQLGRRFPSALEISRFRGESVGGRELGQPLEVRSGIVARRQAELLQIRGTEPERAGVLLGGVVTAVHHALPGNAVGDAEDVRKLVDRRRKSARRNRR